MAVDIKQICDYSDKLRNVSYIVTETVGTTTSYTFPEDTLLPYIKRNVKEYINNHWEDEEIKKMVVALKKQAKVEMEEGWVGAVSIPEGDEVDINAIKDAVATYALNQIENSDLESLQNLIVKDGYSKGQLKGHLFPDVFPAFKKWTAEGKKIFMYSSGLEFSQNCLIANSVEGDITELISGCFNSSEFPRTKSESFREMCKKVNSEPEKVVLLTDNAPTARAARKAGLVVIMLCREGNSYVGNCIRESFPVITSFDEISQLICTKRKKCEEESESPTGKKAKMDESINEADAKVEEGEKKDKVEEEVKTKMEEEEAKTEVSTNSNEKAEVKEDAKEPVKCESEMEVDVKESVSKEAAKEEENVEMMEVDGVKTEEATTKTEEESADIKIVVTPPEDEKANKKAMTTIPEETDKEKDETEKSEEKVEDKKIEEETVKEEAAKEEKEVVKPSAEDKIEEKSVETVKEEKDEAKSENVKETEDVESKTEKKEDTAEKEETKEKVEEVEKEKEERSPEKVCVIENGDAYVDDSNPSDGVTENGDAEKDEVCTNGVEHENGKVDDEKDKKVESTEKESVKAVPKKAEIEESVTDAAAQ